MTGYSDSSNCYSKNIKGTLREIKQCMPMLHIVKNKDKRLKTNMTSLLVTKDNAHDLPIGKRLTG